MGFAAHAPPVTDVVRSLTNNANAWLVDSGATHHMATGRGAYVLGKEEHGPAITLASGGTAAVVGQGTATIQMDGSHQAKTITLDNALCVPELQENLLSVAAVDKMGGAVAFLGGRCYLYQNADIVRGTGVLAQAGATGALDLCWQYMLGDGGSSPEAMVASAAVAGVPVVWHRRFFHLGFTNLAKAAKIVRGMPPSEVVPERVAGAICHPCAQGKLTRAPHTASATTAPRMSLIHSDTSGPFTPSLGGALHFVTLLDDKTKLLLAIPIAAKSHVGAVLRAKIPMLERLCGDKAKRIRFDGAKEYVTKEMLDWYASAGIDYEVTPPYSSQSNGAAECFNRTVKEMVRSALTVAGMEQELWAEALAAAVYARNRSPHTGRYMTPWEAFNGEKPDVSGFRVWGSKAYALLPDKQQRGMNPKPMEGHMVGYGARGVGYWVMNPTNNTVVVRRDVAIDETGGAAMTSPPLRGVHWREGIGASDDEREPADGGTPAPTPGTSPALTPSSSGTGPTAVAAAPMVKAIAAARRSAPPPSDDEAVSEEEEVRRYPLRDRMPPRHWGGDANVATVATAAVGGNVAHHDQLPPPPKDVRTARTRQDWPQWKAALEVGESSMTRNKVWRVADKPNGRRALRTKVILEYKFKQDGTLDRYKARLVALG